MNIEYIDVAYEWEEEVYCIDTEEYKMMPRYTECVVRIKTYPGTQIDPPELTADIVENCGDDYDETIENKIIEKAIDYYKF